MIKNSSLNYRIKKIGDGSTLQRGQRKRNIPPRLFLISNQEQPGVFSFKKNRKGHFMSKQEPHTNERFERKKVTQTCPG